MKKILVIDDDKGISEVVTIILEGSGFEVHSHHTGLNVQALVSDFDPDLILLDIMLPGKLGTEVCFDLKKEHACPPIVLFSAHAAKDLLFKLCNADAFIQKPFEVANLLSVVEHFANPELPRDGEKKFFVSERQS